MADSCINMMVLEELDAEAAAVDNPADFCREDCNLILDDDHLDDGLLITFDIDKSGRLSGAVNLDSVDRKRQGVNSAGTNAQHLQEQPSTSFPNHRCKYEAGSSNYNKKKNNYNSKRCRSMEPLIRHTSITNVQYLQKAAAAAKHVQACNGNGRLSAPSLFTNCLLSFIPLNSSAFNDQLQQDIDIDIDLGEDDKSEVEAAESVEDHTNEATSVALSPARPSVKIAGDRPPAVISDNAVKPHRRSSKKCCSAFVPNSCVVNSSRHSSMSLSAINAASLHHRIATSENVTATTMTVGSGNDLHKTLLPDRGSSRNSINSIRLMSHAEIEQNSVETEYIYLRRSFVNGVDDGGDISPSRWAEAAAADEAAAMARASTAECCSCVNHVFPLRRMIKRVTAGKMRTEAEESSHSHSHVQEQRITAPVAAMSKPDNCNNRVWPYGNEAYSYGYGDAGRRSNCSSTSSKHSSNERYRTAAALNGLYRTQYTEVISLREMHGRRTASGGAAVGSPMAHEVVQTVSNLQESPVASTFLFNDYHEMMMVRRSSCSNSSSCRSSSVSSADVLSRRESCSSNEISHVGHRGRARQQLRRVRLPEEVYVSRICSLRSAGTGVSSGTSRSYRTATDGSSNRLDELHVDQSPLHLPQLLATSSLNFSR